LFCAHAKQVGIIFGDNIKTSIGRRYCTQKQRQIFFDEIYTFTHKSQNKIAHNIETMCMVDSPTMKVETSDKTPPLRMKPRGRRRRSTIEEVLASTVKANIMSSSALWERRTTEVETLFAGFKKCFNKYDPSEEGASLAINVRCI